MDAEEAKDWPDDEANDWPDGFPLWTARVLLRVKEYLEGGMDEEALAYVDDRLEHLFIQTIHHWSAYEQWLSGLYQFSERLEAETSR